MGLRDANDQINRDAAEFLRKRGAAHADCLNCRRFSLPSAADPHYRCSVGRWETKDMEVEPDFLWELADNNRYCTAFENRRHQP